MSEPVATERQFIDLRVACPRCHQYETRLDEQVGMPKPCTKCGNQAMEVLWWFRVERPEDEDDGL